MEKSNALNDGVDLTKDGILNLLVLVILIGFVARARQVDHKLVCILICKFSRILKHPGLNLLLQGLIVKVVKHGLCGHYLSHVLKLEENLFFFSIFWHFSIVLVKHANYCALKGCMASQFICFIR